MNTPSTTPSSKPRPPATARDNDPLLRALVHGDEHCADGKALAQLGRLLRSQQPRASDLRSRVESRLAVADEHLASADDERVDLHYEHGGDDGDLTRLRSLFTTLAPAPVDLRERVRKQLLASQRLAPVSDEAPVSSRAQAVQVQQRHRRLRLISAVVVGHLAAVLVIAILFAHRDPTPNSDSGTSLKVLPPVPRLPEGGPLDWTQIPGSGFDLFALRRSPELRAAARMRFNSERSAGAVACGLRWLATQQGSDGGFPAANPATDNRDAALCRQALVIIALLGEGGGMTSVDRERLDCAQRALAALTREPLLLTTDSPPRARALVTLAQVEGSLWGLCPSAIADGALRDLAEQAPSGELDGFAVLAIETAVQAGMSVPPVLRERTRQILLTPADASEPELARLGLAAFARATLGYRDNPATAALGEALATRAPTATSPREHQGWLFATLALRELGGTAWDTWIAGLQSRVLPTFIDAGPGLAFVGGSTANGTGEPLAEDTIWTTAATVLELQTAYRYLPLGR